MTLGILALASLPFELGSVQASDSDGELAPYRSAEAFIENAGQWDGRAQFLAKANGLDLWLTEDGVTYDLRSVTTKREGGRTVARGRGHVVRMEFLGSKPGRLVSGRSELAARHNYFVGDKSRWASDVRLYREASMEDIYEGISARWYFDSDKPRYDLIVEPGADPSRIRMRFHGADRVVAADETLKLATSLGDFEQRGLFAYQRVGATRRPISCRFVAEGDVVRFDVGDYDRSKPLVIDPIIWSTFLGGSSTDETYGVNLDASNRPIVLGSTISSDFPVTVGAYDETISGPGFNFDATVTKLTSKGAGVLWSTFVGGAGGGMHDFAYDAAVDAAGNVVVVGESFSSDFPTTGGAFDTTANGGYDAVAFRLNNSGSSLMASTYLGGSGGDGAQELEFDAGGNLVIVGTTRSANFPTTAGAHQPTFGGGVTDVFVTKMAPDLSTVLKSTFLGGSAEEEGYSIAILPNGSVWVCGFTSSPNFPTTANAFQTTLGGGWDAMASRLSPNLNLVEASTFIGGPDNDSAASIALAPGNRPVIAGYTHSANFPTKPGAFDRTHNGNADSFVTRFNTNASSIEAGTLYGGANADYATGLAVDFSGNAIIAIQTSSADLPTTVGAHDRTQNGSADVALVKLTSEFQSRRYATFVGGSADDYPFGIVRDSSGNILACGYSLSANYPTTAGAFDTSLAGGVDGFVTRVQTGPVLLNATLPKTTFVGGFAIPLTLTLDQPVGDKFNLVELTTTNPGKVFAPATTKIAAGKTSKTLNIRTETVLTDTLVTLTAICNGVSKELSFTLQPGGLQSVKADPNVRSSGQVSTGTVNLSGNVTLAAGRTVTLSTTSNKITMPPSVTIAQGAATANFQIQVGTVSSSTSATVEAKLGSMSKTTTIGLNP